ncbi:hypothetical protein J6A31_05905 [bacterium]|nr:hypothetical protein [bacterium]
MGNLVNMAKTKLVTTSCRKATGLDPYTAGLIIMSRSEIRDGKIYSPSGKKIGWFNQKTGIGWCNLKGFNEIKDLAPNYPEFDPTDYDEVDFNEYFDDSDDSDDSDGSNEEQCM